MSITQFKNTLHVTLQESFPVAVPLGIADRLIRLILLEPISNLLRAHSVKDMVAPYRRVRCCTQFSRPPYLKNTASKSARYTEMTHCSSCTQKKTQLEPGFLHHDLTATWLQTVKTN